MRTLCALGFINRLDLRALLGDSALLVRKLACLNSPVCVGIPPLLWDCTLRSQLFQDRCRVHQQDVLKAMFPDVPNLDEAKPLQASHVFLPGAGGATVGISRCIGVFGFVLDLDDAVSKLPGEQFQIYCRGITAAAKLFCSGSVQESRAACAEP